MLLRVFRWMRVSRSLCPARSMGAPASSPHVSWVCPPNPKTCILLSTWYTFLHILFERLLLYCHLLSIRGWESAALTLFFFNALLTMFPTVLRRVASPAVLFFGLVCHSPGASVFRRLCQLVFSRLLRLFQLRSQLPDFYLASHLPLL